LEDIDVSILEFLIFIDFSLLIDVAEYLSFRMPSK